MTINSAINDIAVNGELVFCWYTAGILLGNKGYALMIVNFFKRPFERTIWLPVDLSGNLYNPKEKVRWAFWN